MISGSLRLRIQDEMYELKAGDAIHFSADQAHVYENLADEKTKFNTIICYPL
ncbi:Cupin domain protein [compost metagenome]